MRWSLICAAGILVLAGCGLQKKSSLLLERHAKGPLADSRLIGQRIDWNLAPQSQHQEQGEVEVEAEFASPAYLSKFFADRNMFTEYAGHNPYFPENIVFYVRIKNESKKPIRINPGEFVLVDNRGNQYATIDADYVNALADARAPMATMTRGVIEDTRPGYLGFSLPIGKMVASKPQGRFALIRQSTMLPGILQPGVVYDGILAFWSPVKDAKRISLLITNIKTNFDANDLPQTTLEFAFPFNVLNQ